MNIVLNNIQCRYTPVADTVDGPVFCGVCGEEMTVSRQQGPRSWHEAISGIETDFDLFECPRLNEDWHVQVVALRQEKRQTQSNSLRELLESEIGIILQTRKSTLCPLNIT